MKKILLTKDILETKAGTEHEVLRFDCSACIEVPSPKHPRHNSRRFYLSELEGMYEWASELGLEYKTLHRRIKLGWTTKAILSKPYAYRKNAGKTCKEAVAGATQ